MVRILHSGHYSKNYIENHFSDIVECENVIEKRMYAFDMSMQDFILENEHNLKMCTQNKLDYYLIEGEYKIDFSRLNLKLPF